MSDDFEDFMHGLEAPARDGFDITPDDSADLEKVTRAIHVGSGGAVRVTLLNLRPRSTQTPDPPEAIVSSRRLIFVGAPQS